MSSHEFVQAPYDLATNSLPNRRKSLGMTQRDGQDAFMIQISHACVAGASPSQASPPSHGRAVHLNLLPTSSVSPIGHLPTEVLSTIFRTAVRLLPFSSAPLLLVCRNWHQIMMADPLLWSVIKIDCKDGNDGQWMLRQAEYARVALVRSKSSLLDIVINMSSFDCESLGNTMSQLQDIRDRIKVALLPVDILRGKDNCVAHRWRYLEILLPQEESDTAIELATEIIERFEDIRTLNLQELLIKRGVVIPSEEAISTFSLFTFGPSLKYLSTMYIDLGRMSLVPDSLERLKLVIHTEWSSILAILKQSHLNSLNLKTYCDSLDWADNSSGVDRENPLEYWDAALNTHKPTTFRYLDRLSIHGCFPKELYPLFNFPALRTLAIWGEYALDIFVYNKTFFPSVQTITWHPPYDTESFLDPGSQSYKPEFVEKLQLLAACHLPSLRKMLLPISCVPFVFPSLATAAQELVDNTGSQVSVLIENGVITSTEAW